MQYRIECVTVREVNIVLLWKQQWFSAGLARMSDYWVVHRWLWASIPVHCVGLCPDIYAMPQRHTCGGSGEDMKNFPPLSSPNLMLPSVQSLVSQKL